MLLGISASLVGCTHSEPFPTGHDPLIAPFGTEQPARLTYALGGANQRPSFSADGRFIVYAHPDPDAWVDDHDHDICLGVLPATGGQRVATVCRPSSNDRFMRDGIEHGALGADGMLAFVHQSGVADNGTVLESGLHLAPIDSLAGSREIFRLKRQPSGALDRWDVFLNLTWDGPDRLVALATRMELVVPAPNAPPDTIYTGIEVVELAVGGPETTWSRIAPAPGATALAWDGAGDRAYYLRDNRVHRAADGAVHYALEVPQGAVAGEISGLAAADGIVYTSERFLSIGEGNDVEAVTRIVRIAADGTPSVLLARTSAGTVRVTWTRLTVSPDATHAAFEQVGNGQWSIFLAELPQ